MVEVSKIGSTMTLLLIDKTERTSLKKSGSLFLRYIESFPKLTGSPEWTLTVSVSPEFTGDPAKNL